MVSVSPGSNRDVLTKPANSMAGFSIPREGSYGAMKYSWTTSFPAVSPVFVTVTSAVTVSSAAENEVSSSVNSV